MNTFTNQIDTTGSVAPRGHADIKLLFHGLV